ncbi:MAG: alpha/beta fold hydrolase [Spirochaetaceae bacterium]|nr:MAG: alpha/beta fold hydrolase [Spirochaetaceae bacterium]
MARSVSFRRVASSSHKAETRYNVRMRLHVEELGIGPPVLFLHGLFGSGDNWRPQAKHLSKHNHVVLVDLRNHGRSPHAPEMSLELMASDIEDTVQSLGFDRIGILGHSLGGKVAMECVLRNPSGYSGMVVVDIAPKRYPVRHMEIIHGMRAVAVAEPGSRRDADSVLAEYVSEARVRAFLLKSYDTSSQGVKSWRINIDAVEHEYEHIRGGLSENLGEACYHGPALFIGGELSDYLQPEDHERICQLFPKAQVESIADAGHWVHAEQPERFLKVLDGFRDAWS